MILKELNLKNKFPWIKAKELMEIKEEAYLDLMDNHHYNPINPIDLNKLPKYACK